MIMIDFEKLDAENQALLKSLKQNNKFLSFENLNEGFTETETFDDISREIGLNTPFGKKSYFFKPKFISKNIDFVKLSAFIKKNIDTIYNYKNFIGTQTKTVSHVISFGEDAKFDRQAGIPTRYNTIESEEAEIPLSITNKSSGEKVLELNAKLYTDEGIVNIGNDFENDFTGGLEFQFDYKSRIVQYKMHFYYVGKNLVYEADNTDQIAFTISSSNFEDFEAFREIIGRDYKNDNFKNKIEIAFLNAFKEVNNKKDKVVYNSQQEGYNDTKFKALDWLYQKVPYFVTKKLNFTETIENIFKLSNWDAVSIIDDSTASVTQAIQKLDHIEVYKFFLKNPDKLILLLSRFSDEEIVKSFCNYLTAITFLNSGQDIEKARKFTVSDSTHIETNILYGDEEGKVELVNELQLPSFGIFGLAPINLITKDIEINNLDSNSNQFHPLDIIYIQNFDSATGENEEYPTIALYGKYLGDKSEWSDVKDAALAVVDIISIVVSAGALSAGVRGAARLFAILDIAIGTINLATLSPEIRSQLNKTEGGRWFLAHWGIISFCVSASTISYYLAKGILKYSGQAKNSIKNEPKLIEQIEELELESKKVVNEVSEFTIKNFSGSGGFLKFKKIISRKIDKQEELMSCAAACVKQLIKDNGQEIPESIIRSLAGTTLEGTYADGIVIALKKYFDIDKIDCRMMYDPKLTDVEMLKKISRDNNSWIAWISPNPGSNTKHAVIVDKIKNKEVYIRDPWPLEAINESSFNKSINGVIGTVDVEEFASQWANGFNFMFKVKK
jgi:hypothetical protein